MKWGTVILLLGLLSLLCACGSRSYPPSLLTADSLASVRPDSALSLLKALERDTADMPLAHRMYYRLLCVKAADKAYLPHTSDSLIRPILHYYIKEDDPRLLPEAYYYAGRVYRDLGDAPQALDYFEQSLEAMRKHENLKVKSKVYAQMGTLFLYQDMYPEALEAFKQSYLCDVALGDSVGMIFSYRDIANAYWDLNQTDSALIYYQQAYRLSKKMNRMDLGNGVQSQLANLYMDLGQYDSARTSLSEALCDIEYPDSSGIYTIAGRYYYETGQNDSAIWYYTQLLRFGNVYSKKVAYRHLLQMGIHKANLPILQNYLTHYNLYVDSVQRIKNVEAVSRVHSLYNYQWKEKEYMHLQTDNMRHRQYIYLISSILLLVIMFFGIYWQYAKHKRKLYEIRLNQIQQLKEEAERREQRFIQETQEHIQSLTCRLNETVQENKIVHEAIQVERERYSMLLQKIEAEQGQRKLAEQTIPNSIIVKSLLKKAKSPKGVTTVAAKEWKALQELISLYYPTFFENLESLYYHFKEEDWHLNMLIKVGFTPSDMSVLLGQPVQTVTTKRRRLAEYILHPQKATPQLWDEFIRSL